MLTEEQAGSDAGALQTTAELKGDEYIVNGAKRHILGGTHADSFILVAITDPSQGKRGISALIMERGFPGIEVVEKYDMMEVRGCGVARLTLTDVRIPRQNLPGKEVAMAKLFASECAVTVTGVAAQIHGGSGYMKDKPIERLYRDARILTVYEGTSEVQRMVVAAAAMKQ